VSVHFTETAVSNIMTTANNPFNNPLPRMIRMIQYQKDIH